MDKKIFIVCQDNSWVNESIFYMYLNQILFKSSEKNSNNKTMIVFDRARSHFSERINELFEYFKSKYSLIPPGQTSYIQPLDVSINKSFKSAIHKKYTQFQIDNKNSKKPTRENIIDFIHDIWYEESIITKEMIINAFKICGISNSMDGSEDEMFKWPDDIIPNIQMAEPICASEDEDEDDN